MYFQIVHEFDVSPQVYFEKIHFDPEFNTRLHQILDLKEYTELEREENERELKRRIRVVPNRDIPGVMKKVAGGGSLAYTEINTFHKAEYRIDWKVVPDMMPNKVKSEGTFAFVPLGEGRSKRVVEGVVEVSVFGVGGMIEKTIVNDLKETYHKAAELVRAFAKERGLA